MTSALAAVLGMLICGGLVLIVAAAFHPATGEGPLPQWRRHIGVLIARRRPHIIRLGASIAGGILAGTLSGLPILILAIPALAYALPLLLSAPRNHDLELLQSLDRWVRSLTALLGTGRSVGDAIRASARQAPVGLGPGVRAVVARLDDRWTIEQALRALADELDSPDADAVLAALILAAKRGGTGAGATLSALADNLQDRIEALRVLESERAKPRIVVRQVTILTISMLSLAFIFGGSFFAPYASPLGQLLLACLIAAYIGSLLILRRMTLPRPRQRILRSAP